MTIDHMPIIVSHSSNPAPGHQQRLVSQAPEYSPLPFLQGVFQLVWDGGLQRDDVAHIQKAQLPSTLESDSKQLIFLKKGHGRFSFAFTA